MNSVTSALEYIYAFESALKDHAQTLRKNPVHSEMLENSLTKPLTICKVDGTICAVDAGLIAYNTHGVDFVLIKSVAVAFSYVDSKLNACEYYPSRITETRVEVKNALDEQESNLWKSLVRLKNELTTALITIEKYHPLVLLMDGSLLPLASDRPGQGSEVNSLYTEVITLYKNLYTICKKENISLIGVIKDSRGKRFMEGLSLLTKCNDSTFLQYFLEAKERTSAINYSKTKNQILEEVGEEICLFYMKITKNDRPLRVEFLSGSNFDTVASLVYSLSAIHDSFAYPAALIEVDLCAMIDDKDLEQLKHSLSIRSELTAGLRRNTRPFR